jgi:hypothetical protein
MEAQIRIGSRRSFTLKQAVLIYRDNSAAFATLHNVQNERNQSPYLGPGQSLRDRLCRPRRAVYPRSPDGNRRSTEYLIRRSRQADCMDPPPARAHAHPCLDKSVGQQWDRAIRFVDRMALR